MSITNSLFFPRELRFNLPFWKGGGVCNSFRFNEMPYPYPYMVIDYDPIRDKLLETGSRAFGFDFSLNVTKIVNPLRGFCPTSYFLSSHFSCSLLPSPLTPSLEMKGEGRGGGSFNSLKTPLNKRINYDRIKPSPPPLLLFSNPVLTLHPLDLARA